jgi:hypothetical protein
MLTEEKLLWNKERFLDLVGSIEREGMNRDLLYRQLTESDFFTAPASSKYHGNYPGGLCEHSLNVYDNLCALTSMYYRDVPEDSIKIVALFHDFSKMNFYTTEVKNKKVYSDKGKKTDSSGKYDWESVIGYGIRDLQNRFMVGNHEENSAFMINSFLPLSVEEWCAIMHHHASLGMDSTKQNPAEYWTKFPLSLLLYQADCIAAFIQEKQ